MAALSLSQLLDVAIGTPQVGAVNFPALHSLLQAMLRHLGLQDLPALGRGHSPTPLLGRDQPPEAPPREEGGQGGGPGTESLTPAKDPLQGTVSTPQDASVAADVEQMKIKIEENESSISKAVALSQDLLEEIGGMKAAQSRMEEDIRMIRETLGMKNLKERLSLYPAPEEVSNMVRWEVLEDCLVGSKAGGGEGGGVGGGESRGLSVVAQLEASKSDHAELEKLRLLFSEGEPGLKGETPSLTACPLGPHLDKESITSVLADLQGRIRQLEDAVGKLEVAGANWKGDVSEQITLQLG
ncbi:uncharacterized protein LOC141933270 [Strix aluco]|uniref:uncharacterized protein LOC141933270 n=1 Tax=Strix aluco TaxID=111821 RepID=UPI003DA4087A